MMIKSKLTEQDFINVNFVLLYSKISMKIFTGIIIFFLIISVMTTFLFSKISYSQIFVFIFMLSAIPILTYFTAKKNFVASQRISETIEYQFDKDNMFVKGESFTSQLTWNKIYKVTQTKNWILIWQNRQIANPIPKKDILEGKIEDLKKILKEHNVKNNL